MTDRHYFTKSSNDDDINKFSSYVNAKFFPSHVEVVGVSYARHFKTIPELETEIEEIKKLPLSHEEYLKRLKSLEEQLAERKRPHKPRTLRSKFRTDSMQSLKRSRQTLMDYAYANFDVPYVLVGTFTYKIKVFSMKQVVADFKRFRRKFKDKFPNALWLAVYEYHADGSIHIHMLMRNVRGATHDVLTEMWGHGLVYVKELEHGTLPYFCKADRLEMYPSGARLFTKSANCKKPKNFKLSIEQYNELTQNMECTYTKAKTLYMTSSSDETKKVNHYIYKNFKRKED